ncbi:MAG: competence type IV pilus major pilin ComGC [Atopobiaceae bacterium]|jgi:type IV pilus assembly protein PilA
MLDMVKARKAELEKRGYKGFTLMEMLIVVAIIAVLVAIAIPIFTTQLNKARAATDEANIRSGYAYVMSTVLTTNVSDGATFTLNSDGTAAQDTTGTYKTQAASTDLGQDANIGGQKVEWSKDAQVTYTYKDNKVTITAGK